MIWTQECVLVYIPTSVLKLNQHKQTEHISDTHYGGGYTCIPSCERSDSSILGAIVSRYLDNTTPPPTVDTDASMPYLQYTYQDWSALLLWLLQY